MSSIANAIVAAAQAAGIDPKLALEVATDESGMNPNTPDGTSGEIGIFQILPSTGRGLGYTVDQLRDPLQNIQAGVKLLKQLLSRYGDPAAALAAYNWGPGNAQDPRLDAVLSVYGSDWFGHIPGSTQAYINKILGNVQTQYAASVGPIPVPAVFASAPAIAPLPTSGMSVWTQVAIAVGVIFGISLLLSE
jgi:soluble lytic murein transglycosylase-like protein